MRKVLLIFGTRPEAIKMAPVYRKLRGEKRLLTQVCVTAQHREMLDQVLKIFQITPSWDLNIMKEHQDLTHTTTACLTRLSPILAEYQPDLVLVHGDTTTTLAAALASYYQKIPIAHVEAGLRTHDKYRPFPEEVNRLLTDALSTLHFAPTAAAKKALTQEGHPPASIFVTGNTVIDALQTIVARQAKPTRRVEDIIERAEGKKLLVVTAHRRESFGKPMQEIAKSLLQIAKHYPDLFILFSTHKNPEARKPLKMLRHPRIFLTDPLPYLPFVQLMQRAHFLLTDSGGLQEEGPALRKPVLVLREVTERPEAIHAGTARLVGTRAEKIFSEVSRLLNSPRAYRAMQKAENPYGDGLAATRILHAILYFFGLKKRRPRDFSSFQPTPSALSGEHCEKPTRQRHRKSG